MSSPNDYTVGWVCALVVEAVAATVFLDERLKGPATQEKDDTNNYKFGKINDHYVVIATLPKGEYGISGAASVAKDLTRSFRNVRIGLMVGIGGGAPSSKNDIRLGDVVVSIPEKGHTGIFQYDYGESEQDKSFKYTRTLDQPPQLLRTAVGSLEVDHEIYGNGIEDAITKVLEKNPNLKKKYGRPSEDTDILFQPTVVHVGGDSCDTCSVDEANVVDRELRQHDRSLIHHGTIASANTLMKNAILRNSLASQNNVLCFEMEAAGLMNGFSCLIIRGICDYSDSHKHKGWQGYAAMAAAAYAKQIVSIIRPQQVEEVPTLGRSKSNPTLSKKRNNF
jgi:nucleoside phosphorylase